MIYKFTDCRFLQAVMATDKVVTDDELIMERDKFIEEIPQLLYSPYHEASTTLAVIRFMLETALGGEKSVFCRI